MGFNKEANSYSNGLLRPLPREDTPLMGKSKPLSSQSKTFANVFISIVGAGVLGLPYTFMRTGWLTSLIMIFVVAALTYHCMMLLIHTRRKLESLRFRQHRLFWRPWLRRLWACWSIRGRCHGRPLSSRVWGISAKSFYIWSSFPFQVGLNLIPSLTLLVEDVLIFTKHRPVAEAFRSLSMFFYGLGVAVYSFEGIGMVLPLESEMKDKSKFGKILGLTMLFIAFMYGSFAE